MKIFKLNVLAFGLVATLALSSCGNSQKKATEEKPATEVATQVKEEGCAGNCEGCPNADAKKECTCTPDSKEPCDNCKAEATKGCEEKSEGSCDGCPGEKKECAGECGDC